MSELDDYGDPVPPAARAWAILWPVLFGLAAIGSLVATMVEMYLSAPPVGD
jgi:hypothetical protein